ncbi:hypothetical protein BA895_11225 [Humibacillus sp. DSM 29435]|uniref:hypothetical protein n=1 Tax=Humibacillus sp. DSM 29435 TaxID=1869167 RepID=UPI0008721051|nr:hypothetical protein [Humibacillus sp. DSM 29435]OFE14190.1 hypothetical protein BA895_11225 [Humibacillus sp. DSM 29435]
MPLSRVGGDHDVTLDTTSDVTFDTTFDATLDCQRDGQVLTRVAGGLCRIHTKPDLRRASEPSRFV